MYSNLIKIFSICIIFSVNCVLLSNKVRSMELNSVSFYGLSHHFDDNNGEGYNELNYGVAVSAAILKDFFELEVGYFRNSFNDDAYWVSLQKEFKLTKYFSFAGEARHWETANNTYAPKVFQIYPHLRLYLNSKITTNVILRESGPIFYLRLNFR